MPEYLKHEKAQSNTCGRVKIGPVTPPARSLPMCTKCFCLLKRGVSHICNKKQKRENLGDFVRSNSDTTKSKVTSSLLKSICTDTGVSSSGGTVSLATGGKPLPVTVGKPSTVVRQPRFTFDSLKRLQSSINLSDRQTK